jgi:type IV secretion system protein VirB5
MSALKRIAGLFGLNAPNTVGENETSEPADAKAVSPYLAARRDVNDRLSIINRGRFFHMAISSLLGAALLISVAGNIYFAGTSRVEPYYIALNEDTGDILQAGMSDGSSGVTETMVRNQIETFITGIRTVYVDRRATIADYEQAWGYVLPGSKAERFLEDHFEREGGSPAQEVGRLQRSVVEMEIDKVEGTRSWRVEWIEREAEPSGDMTEHIYRGSISIRKVELSTREALEKNPIGVFIEGLTWRETDSRALTLDGTG